ncbi:MAG: M1 family metallopeptidase [Candidatus Colwellbacteria bacterium]|nr:M1 family metallopeptidase [Candidatus Colwellbacteria bacterium]
MKSSAKQGVRLPAHIKPLRYKISLKPDLEAFTFEGVETINLALGKSSNQVTLHSKELDIESAEVTSGKEKTFALKIDYDERAETATFTFPNKIRKGNIQLKIVFRGVLNDKMNGFYKSHYKVGDKTHYIATTQFEATDARRAFPCFDEPAAKAVFDISLIVPQKSTAISNTMPTEILEHGMGYKIVNFAPTPKMSTYLLAFIVGDFEHIEKRTKDGVLVRVFVTPGKIHQAQFALECATKIISFFNKYFDIPYPLPVMDLIAIPDFSVGAMENWGAITYRESAILLDPEHSSTTSKQWIALVIAHELSHQWFGNLVTMEWWTHIWLNEGFASYIEYLAVDHLFPKWDIWTQFIHNDLGTALEFDALQNTHPVEIDVHHPEEISEIFDAVSYSKGASIIRMLAEYLGETDFRNGLRYYLKKHSYSNTSTIHLWKALEKVSGKPVEKMMSGWTRKSGYPLITVSENKGRLMIEQKRFFSSPISESKTKDAALWRVPVSYKTNDTKLKKQFLLTKQKVEITKPTGEWIKFNINESGFFRTNYSDNLRKALEDSVKTKRLGAGDRLGLIRDIMALTESGKIPTVKALEFAKHYKNETDYTVWLELASDLNKIHFLIAHEPFVKEYESFAAKIFAPIAEKAGWTKKPNENHTQTLLRSLALSSFGTYGDLETINQAKELFGKLKDGKNSIHADLRSVVYNLTTKNGGVKEYEKLAKMYKAVSLHEEKNRIGRALGNFRNKNLLKKTLAFSLSKHVRPQDTIGIIAGVWFNPDGHDLAWNFVKANWEDFLKRYGGGHSLSRLLACAGSSASAAQAKNFKDFFKKNAAPGAKRTIEQALESINSNVAWLMREKIRLAKYFLK